MPNPKPTQTPEFQAQIKPRPLDVPADVEIAKQPICVRFPVYVDEKLREMSDRSAFIRGAVAEKLDETERVQQAIEQTLLSIPPRDRRAARRLFKKLTERLN